MTGGGRGRLLLVVNIPRFFLSHRLALALEAARRGYEVHVMTSNEDPEGLARIAAHGLHAHGVPLAQHGTTLRQELRTLVAIARGIRDVRPDVLHLITIKPVLYGGLAARVLGVPRVVAALTGLGRAFGTPRGAPRWLRIALRAAVGGRRTTLLVQNADDEGRVRDLDVVRGDAIVLIRGSGVDPDRFVVRPEPDTPTLLHGGRLMRSKGVDAFIEVARRLSGRARFVIAGYVEAGAPDAMDVGDLEALDRAGVIEWLGNRDDMPDVIAGATAVVLPTTYPEGVPRILIEAASCGRPTIATDVPGCREICLDGTTGLLVPPDDVAALERAVGRLIDDPGLRARMGAAGRRLVEERFTLASVVDRTLALYGDRTARSDAGRTP